MMCVKNMTASITVFDVGDILDQHLSHLSFSPFNQIQFHEQRIKLDTRNWLRGEGLSEDSGGRQRQIFVP